VRSGQPRLRRGRGGMRSQVWSAGGGIAVRGVSPLREELVRPRRTRKAKARRLPLLATLNV
jgi:hypothetical protein